MSPSCCEPDRAEAADEEQTEVASCPTVSGLTMSYSPVPVCLTGRTHQLFPPLTTVTHNGPHRTMPPWPESTRAGTVSGHGTLQTPAAFGVPRKTESEQDGAMASGDEKEEQQNQTATRILRPKQWVSRPGTAGKTAYCHLLYIQIDLVS